MTGMLADVETAALDQALRGLSNYDNRVRASAATSGMPKMSSARRRPHSTPSAMYIFTHPNMRQSVDGRFTAIQAAMDRVSS
jgi:hypothetical protein